MISLAKALKDKITWADWKVVKTECPYFNEGDYIVVYDYEIINWTTHSKVDIDYMLSDKDIRNTYVEKF